MCYFNKSAIRLKTKDHQFDNFVVTGGTVSNDNLRYHQWRQSCQIDDFLSSLLQSN